MMMTDPLKDRIITAITDAMPSEMDMVRASDFADAAENVMRTIHVYIAPNLVLDIDRMVDLVDVEHANVMIGEHGRRLWVCTENGTVLRIKAKNITLDDRRINKEADDA